MAKAETEGGKRGRKAAMKADRQPEPDPAPIEVPPEPEAIPAARGRGRKPGGIPKAVTFFERLAAFPLADWGTRAKVTVYRLEPITNNLLGSDKKYIKVYNQPPVTEERIKQDCGSGRYRLYLTYKAAGENEREVDSIEFDILDTNFPPKVPKGAWLDDPRNAHWGWAKELYERQNSPASLPGAMPQPNVLETIDGILDVSERLRPAQPPAKSATDELAVLVTVAEKLRPPETVPAFMQAQFTALQNQITAAQERGDKMLMLLLDERRKGSTDTGIGAIKQVTDGLKELLPAVKEFFPNLGEGIGGGPTSRMNGWQELAVQVAPHAATLFGPLLGVVGQAMFSRMTGATGPTQRPANPGGAPQPTPGQAPQLPGPTMMPFLQMIATPLMNYARTLHNPKVDPAELGHDFASWVFDGYGTHPEYANAIMAAKTMGTGGVLAAFQQTPLWTDKGPNGMMPSLAELQNKLPQFFTAFLDYDPNADDPNAEDDENAPVGPPQVVTYRGDGAEAAV